MQTGDLSLVHLDYWLPRDTAGTTRTRAGATLPNRDGPIDNAIRCKGSTDGTWIARVSGPGGMLSLGYRISKKTLRERESRRLPGLSFRPVLFCRASPLSGKIRPRKSREQRPRMQGYARLSYSAEIISSHRSRARREALLSRFVRPARSRTR